MEREADARLHRLVAALVLAELSDRVLLWRKGLEGMGVERSQVVLE